ncbi:MAG TPA: hypothetical protein VNK26_00890 [Pyrinomonadaceae bacterium]|nr:hypothetical protein [Pyrinomonadaceae bacterium]
MVEQDQQNSQNSNNFHPASDGIISKLGKRALHLRIVEAFLTQVEFQVMQKALPGFDTSEIKSSLSRLREIADADDADFRSTADFISMRLADWFNDLVVRDSKLEAYHIRRYCDGLRSKPAMEVFIALARFYRELPLDRRSLSKFDLAITRAFSTNIGELRRTMTVDRTQLCRRLAKLFEEWDDQPFPETEFGENGLFDELVEECISLEDFETLVSSRLFDRIREFKASLGKDFFKPAVIAAAIECNIAVGNRLSHLMTQASESLGEKLSSEFDLGGAFNDASPHAERYVTEVLSDLRSNGISQNSHSSDVELLRNIFNLTATLQDEHFPANGHSADNFPIDLIGKAVQSGDFTILGLTDDDFLLTRSARELSLSSDSANRIYSEIGKILAGIEFITASKNSALVYEKLLELISEAEANCSLLDMGRGSSEPERALYAEFANLLLKAILRAQRFAFRIGMQTIGLNTDEGMILPPKPDVLEPSLQGS